MLRRTLLLAAAFLVLAATPAHAQYSQLTISIPSSVVPGQFVTITLTNFPPNTPIVIRVLPNGEVDVGINQAAPPTSSPEPVTTATTAPSSTTTSTTTSTTMATTTRPSTTTTTRPRTTTTRRHRPWWPSEAASQADAKVLGTMMSNERGEVTGQLPVPADLPTGAAVLSASASAPDGSVQATQTETEVRGATAAPAAAQAASAAEAPAAAAAAGQAADPAATTPGPNTLPVTGTEATPVSLIAATLIVAGGLLVLGNRRRRRTADSTS